MPTFPHYRQHDAMDCGPTCLRMVAKHYGKNYSIDRGFVLKLSIAERVYLYLV